MLSVSAVDIWSNLDKVIILRKQNYHKARASFYFLQKHNRKYVEGSEDTFSFDSYRMYEIRPSRRWWEVTVNAVIVSGKCTQHVANQQTIQNESEHTIIWRIGCYGNIRKSTKSLNVKISIWDLNWCNVAWDITFYKTPRVKKLHSISIYQDCTRFMYRIIYLISFYNNHRQEQTRKQSPLFVERERIFLC